MDELDRRIVNALQGGFPVCDRPFAVAAAALGIAEAELIARLRALAERGVISRFGPLYAAEGWAAPSPSPRWRCRRRGSRRWPRR